MKTNQVLAALALLLCSCAAAQAVKPLPLYFTAANADHPKFPHGRYLTGVGLSTLSVEDADKDAARNIATQISAQLKSETSSFQQFTSGGSGSGSSEKDSQVITIKADFKHAELVRPVERQRQGETFYSFSVLDRAEADSVLATDEGGNLASFSAAVQRALAARKSGQGGEFSVAAASARKVRAELDGSFIIRRAVLTRPAPGETDYVRERNDLLTAIEAAKAKQVIGVRLKGAVAQAQLSDYAVNSVKDLGLRPDRAACEERRAEERSDATELLIEPTETCGEGSLGERCVVEVNFSARGCSSGGTVGEGTISQMRGMHPSDREKARKSAWDKVTQQAVQAAVRDALKSAVALGGE